MPCLLRPSLIWTVTISTPTSSKSCSQRASLLSRPVGPASPLCSFCFFAWCVHVASKNGPFVTWCACSRMPRRCTLTLRGMLFEALSVHLLSLSLSLSFFLSLFLFISLSFSLSLSLSLFQAKRRSGPTLDRGDPRWSDYLAALSAAASSARRAPKSPRSWKSLWTFLSQSVSRHRENIRLNLQQVASPAKLPRKSGNGPRRRRKNATRKLKNRNVLGRRRLGHRSRRPKTSTTRSKQPLVCRRWRRARQGKSWKCCLVFLATVPRCETCKEQKARVPRRGGGVVSGHGCGVAWRRLV